VEITVPSGGPQRELVELAAENAAETLASLRAQWEADRSKHVQALADLQQALGLATPPNRIEAYDISNLQGTSAAGSMVVFEQGAPNRRLYRRFNIKTVQGQDDFASMEEVLRRRFHRWSAARQESEKPGGKLDPSFGRLPDLLIVDGGKGQLGRAVEVVRQAGLESGFPLVGLAKAHEEIYRPGEPTPVILPRGSHALHLMQRIRDEAHRVALTQHQTQRTRSGLASQLEAIPGIGPSRRKALLRAFGDVDRIRQAPVEDLMGIPGISLEIAQRVKAGL